VGKGRGYGQKCPFFYLPSLPIQTGEGPSGLQPVVGAGVLGVGGGRGRGENGEEGKGIRFPYLIWAVMSCKDGSVAAAGGRWCLLMAAALGRSRGKGRWLPRCEARWGAGPALL
jgi:hypothetical protein